MSESDEDTTAESVAFSALPLDPRLIEAVEALGFESTTPIQEGAIPPLLEGRDVIGRARTGSGKTAAFGLPLLDKVKSGGGPVRAIVLTPTRELALQVTDALRDFARKLPVRVVTIYGGAPYEPQLRALSAGVPVVVGTPGRVIDLLERGALDLSGVEMLVLDEADEMLRMGFIEDVDKVLQAAPDDRQVALFSATMPRPIRKVAERHLHDPLEVQVERRSMTVEHIEQLGIVVPHRHKLEALVRVLQGTTYDTVLIFTRTRRACAEVADALAKRGVACDALHGDLNQAARERVLARLRARGLSVVVATDVAARGIDVQHISHVINLDMPDEPRSYVHRIGRTSRAGRAGTAISFVTPQERHRIRLFEKVLKVRIERMEVPSDADIARQAHTGLQQQLLARIEAGELDQARAVLDHLVDDGGHDAEDLAAAAIALLARERGVSLAPAEDEERPGWARTRRPTRHEGPDPTREVELFMPVGRRQGVRAADIVGALANEAGVPGDQIGRITLQDRKSFVWVPREVADHVLTHHDVLTLRGLDVRLSVARPRRNERPEHPHPVHGRHRKQPPRGPRPTSYGPKRRHSKSWKKGRDRR